MEVLLKGRTVVVVRGGRLVVVVLRAGAVDDVVELVVVLSVAREARPPEATAPAISSPTTPTMAPTAHHRDGERPSSTSEPSTSPSASGSTSRRRDAPHDGQR